LATVLLGRFSRTESFKAQPDHKGKSRMGHDGGSEKTEEGGKKTRKEAQDYRGIKEAAKEGRRCPRAFLQLQEEGTRSERREKEAEF